MTSSLCRRKPAVRLVTRRSTACEQETDTPSPASGIAERRSLSDTVPERPAMPSSLRASLLGPTGRKCANAYVRLSMTLHSSSSTARLWWWGARESIGACKDVNTETRMETCWVGLLAAKEQPGLNMKSQLVVWQGARSRIYRLRHIAVAQIQLLGPTHRHSSLALSSSRE